MTDSPSPTPIPAAEWGGLPDEIAAAIEHLTRAATWYGQDTDDERSARERRHARAALDAAIFARLAALEAERDALAHLNELLRQSHKAVVVSEGQRDAALARAERMEKALAFYADDQNYRLNGPLDPNSGWFEGHNRARAALTAAPAEEEKP